MRPYVFVNVAASLDGKISDESRRQLRISCDEDMKIVDELRASADAVMVGIGTVLADDPRLTVKSQELRKRRVSEGKDENPVRVVVDSRCRVPLKARVLNGEARTIIAVSEQADGERVERVAEYAEVIVSGKDRVDLKTLLMELKKREINRVMVEGGGTLISSLLAEGLVDEMRIYYAPMLIGGESSPTVCDGKSFPTPLKGKITLERVGEGFAVMMKLI